MFYFFWFCVFLIINWICKFLDVVEITNEQNRFLQGGGTLVFWFALWGRSFGFILPYFKSKIWRRALKGTGIWCAFERIFLTYSLWCSKLRWDLTHFRSIFPCDTPWKQKALGMTETFGFDTMQFCSRSIAQIILLFLYLSKPFMKNLRKFTKLSNKHYFIQCSPYHSVVVFLTK